MYENLIRNLRICQDGEHCDRCEFYALKMANGLNGCTEALCKQAADAIEELQSGEKKFLRNISALEMENENLKRERRWIPVAERLPGAGEIVLVYGKKGGIYTAEHNRNAMWPGSFWKLNSKSHHCEPTHWMPLPEPPKGE